MPKTTLEEKYCLEEDCEKSLSSRNNYSFQDLCNLAERAGFKFEEPRRKKGGSHIRIYKHPTYELCHGSSVFDLMNFQPDPKKKSKAKPTQIKQLVKFLREAKPKKTE